MKQRTGTGRLVRQVLIVDSDLAEGTSVAARSVRALAAELTERGVHVIEALSYEDGLATACPMRASTASCSTGPRAATTAALTHRRPNCCAPCASATPRCPIFLMASRKLAGTVSVEVATLADEFIWILDDTASFISGRVQAAIERYIAGAAAALRGGAWRATTASANTRGPRPATRAALRS